MDMLDLGVPIDARLLVVLVFILLGGFAKGVAGQGLPLVATPVIAVLYDLRTAIVINAIPTVLSDVPIILAGLSHLRQAVRFTPFVLFGLMGILVGSQILVSVNQAILAMVLATVVTIFVTTSWFNILPVLSHRVGRILGPPMGLLAGITQGMAGASGPMASMYLLSIGTPRHLYFFSINVIFQILDTWQIFALQNVGLFTPGLTNMGLVICVPTAIGMIAGFRAQRHVNDQLFRRVILVILLLAAANLLGRALMS
ncbi:MAG: sulfite exporter TauE/SafE family protein [Chloroflexi bacterium]|nr:sulfite exporter TauE/SafE family protein [Chloroflexota bacterium]